MAKELTIFSKKRGGGRREKREKTRYARHPKTKALRAGMGRGKVGW